ncbi:uncharacterized protein PV09_00664 [Verruconis gallopava]|uniref:LNS2/PITP domain-containing protein n=1 Tax=Verruconis gallopava TaxID=253628 RepID=A0A0D1Y0W2_9PEZI|nr:uncharacterized protein PV09_00664 [Verruconis gallopava]KIW08721.1 hypothetical protein PV09_00664 [Verruconis gallopava]
MNIIRSTYGSIKQTYNSINPATLSGAIDVIVVEHDDGTLACSPFHVRFGKYQILRPSDKKVEFTVNDVKTNLPMKLGEGGEAFFVFETNERIPEDLQTSPLVSPETSPQPLPAEKSPSLHLPEPEPLDLARDTRRARSTSPDKDRSSLSQSDDAADRNALAVTGQPVAAPQQRQSVSGEWPGGTNPRDSNTRSATDETLDKRRTSIVHQLGKKDSLASEIDNKSSEGMDAERRSSQEAVLKATALSKRLWSANIASKVTEDGDLMLDMSGYGDSDGDAIRVEALARRVLAEELSEEEAGNYDIGSRIGLDESGNIWVYHSEEAKAAADRRAGLQALKYSAAIRSFDAISDPGYHSDEDARSGIGAVETHQVDSANRIRRDSDSAVGVSTPPDSPTLDSTTHSQTKSYAKTLRLTSDQLKQLNLKPGANPMTFTVNKSTCPAYLYLWRHDVPIVISDIDGTITKSDALGHLFNAIGRDWTHAGVAKLYTDIANNGYNLLYLTSRSVGQADMTRNYLNGVVQEGYRLPRGAVIMSPDRTYAALRREVYLRKPEVFKMACLRDIMSLFQPPGMENQSRPRTPFYAGFGNRITDAMSYRSVSIPSTRIFTINSNAEVSMHLLASDQYRTSYVTMRELVDHYFPPVGLLVKEGGEEYTDFNYWRDRPLDIDEFSASESGSEYDEEDGDHYRPSIDESVRSDDGTAEDMDASFYSQGSTDENLPDAEEGMEPGLEGSMILDEDEGSVLTGEPEELEIDDPTNKLGALNLAAETTPHVRAVDDVREDGELGHLSKVLSSPERKSTTI